MKVLFLDFDGVLTYLDSMRRTHEVWDKEALCRLHEVVERTQCRIVVSSSWRHAYSVEQLAEVLFLSKSVVIGKTPGEGEIFTHDVDGRGTQIATWLAGNGKDVTDWAIIDDDVFDLHPWMRSRTVQTESHLGLTDEKVEELVLLLG